MVHGVASASALVLLLATDAVAGDDGPDAAVLAAIGEWLGAEFGLPTVAEFPRFSRVPQEQLTLMRFGVLADAAHGGTDVAAVYSDDERTIYLPLAWTGDTPEELSIVVHEFVHHIQNLAGLRYACPQAREEPAYAAQAAWLARSGSDLASAFGIDALTLFVRTRCLS